MLRYPTRLNSQSLPDVLILAVSMEMYQHLPQDLIEWRQDTKPEPPTLLFLFARYCIMSGDIFGDTAFHNRKLRISSLNVEGIIPFLVISHGCPDVPYVVRFKQGR